jgi:uncharacterized membrane protein
MSEIQHIHLVVAYFDDEDAAKEALKALTEAHKEEGLPMDGAAIVHREEEDKLHLKEVGDTHAKKGAGVGALIGGALGALFGPLGIIGGGAIGAYYGSIVAATVDEGIPNEALEEIGAMLPLGGTALVVLTSESDAGTIEEKLASLGGQVVTNGGEKAQIVVPDDIAAVEESEEDAAGDDEAAGAEDAVA